MNQVYRVVFNRSLGVWQCVSELAKTSGKSSGKTAKPLVVAMAVASAMGNQGALATDYTDGQLHDMGSAYGVVTTDNVSNANTVLQAGQLEFNPNLPTTLNVNNQGKVNITGITFVDSNAQVNIDNATLSSKELLVGYDKAGKVKASNESTINGEWVSIGNQANGSGDITLQNNSVLNIIDNPSNTNAGILEVGNENTGTLNVQNSQVNVAKGIGIGTNLLGKGTINISGQGSNLKSDELSVGIKSSGELNATDNAKIDNRLTFLGYETGSSAKANLTNSLLNTQQLLIARSGNADMATDNSTINATNVGLGQMIGSNAKLTLDNKSVLNSQGFLVGQAGKSTLTVKNGSKINNTTGFNISGNSTNSLGADSTVTVQGTDSTITSGRMAVGASGNGTLNIQDRITFRKRGLSNDKSS